MSLDPRSDPRFRAAAEARAAELIRFIDSGPTPYQVVDEVIRRLSAAGFTRLDEREAWALLPGQLGFVTRGDSSIIAFQVGVRSPAEAGLRLIGAHTDSPNLKLKPRAPLTRSGFRQVGVEVYGGVLLSTWLDRDLSVAGRVLVRGPGGPERRHVHLREPLLRISNLAIHLFREVNSEGLKLNPQNHLPPVWALESADVPETELFRRIADAAQVAREDVLDHDLSLYDTQGGAIGGVDRSFVQTARLDNLGSCFSALGALLEVSESAGEATRVIALFDHEEVGSRSFQGAQGTFLASIVQRLVDLHPEPAAQALPRALVRSLLVSADMAHSIHPNYADRHEPHHQPVIGRGPVLKSNANQSYTTDAEGGAAFAAFCAKAGFAPQHFVTRTDLGCGSTIGPISAAVLGVKTVDVGSPMLSMHSCREQAGVADVELMHRALTVHLRHDLLG